MDNLILLLFIFIIFYTSDSKPKPHYLAIPLHGNPSSAKLCPPCNIKCQCGRDLSIKESCQVCQCQSCAFNDGIASLAYGNSSGSSGSEGQLGGAGVWQEPDDIKNISTKPNKLNYYALIKNNSEIAGDDQYNYRKQLNNQTTVKTDKEQEQNNNAFTGATKFLAKESPGPNKTNDERKIEYLTTIIKQQKNLENISNSTEIRDQIIPEKQEQSKSGNISQMITKSNTSYTRGNQSEINQSISKSILISNLELNNQTGQNKSQAAACKACDNLCPCGVIGNCESCECKICLTTFLKTNSSDFLRKTNSFDVLRKTNSSDIAMNLADKPSSLDFSGKENLKSYDQSNRQTRKSSTNLKLTTQLIGNSQIPKQVMNY